MSVTSDVPTELGQTTRLPGAGPGLVGRFRGMMLSPRTEWQLVAAEFISPRRLYTSFVLPLATIVAGVAFVHVSIVGGADALTGAARAPLVVGLRVAGLVFGCALLGIFLTTLIIDALASFFGASRNPRLACATAAYASTPLWIATVFAPFPTLWALLYAFAVIYHTYLLYLGLPLMMQAPRDKVLGFATTIVLCTILMEIVFTMVCVGLGGATHMNPYRAFG